MASIRSILGAVLAAAALVAGAPAATAYPEGPVHVVIPYTAGAGTDIVFRHIAPYLEKELGAKLVVDNKPGANGDIGNEYAARAAPDGYTLLVNSSNVLLGPLFQKHDKYSVERNFVPISRLVTTQMLMVAHPERPFRTVPEFLDYSRAHPNKLNFGTSGAGTPTDLLAEIIRMRAPAPFVSVPYKGVSLVLTDLVGGQLDFTFTSPLNIKQFVDNGKLRALAITGEQRSPLYPNVPTFKEAGLDIAPLDGGAWWGLFAPAGTPEPVLRHINEALARALAQPELVRKLADGGYTPAPDKPQAYAAQLRREMEAWKQIVPTILNR